MDISSWSNWIFCLILVIILLTIVKLGFWLIERKFANEWSYKKCKKCGHRGFELVVNLDNKEDYFWRCRNCRIPLALKKGGGRKWNRELTNLMEVIYCCFFCSF